MGPEIWIVLILSAMIVLTVTGIVRAAGNHDTGWIIAIVVGWIFLIGWLVGAVYLATHPREPA